MSLRDKIPGFNSIVVPYHAMQSAVAGLKNGFPGRKLRVIGVTGTNGKTTTCFMIWKMLNNAGFKTGLMTTVAWGVPGLSKEYNPGTDGLVKQIEHMTTADAFTLNRRMKAISRAGAEFLVLEVTSHALAQYRILGVPIEIAVMTNVTHEHLDYHRTFERYVAAKTKLFRRADYGIINADDPSCAKFKKATPDNEYITYGIKSGKMKAKSVKLLSSGVEYTFGDIKPVKIHTQIPGEFNVYNSMAAALVGKRLGLTNAQISEGIASLSEVEGRMNRLQLGQDFEVIVDFAHTPDAFEKVFNSVQAPSKNGHIISLFGGAGRRDESTRFDRGKIAGKFSQTCIITEDDSRDEDPLTIMQMFKDGCLDAGMNESNILMVQRREKAIEKAISLAKKGDLVLILGKGHEKTILRANGPEPFEDIKVTTKAIQNRLRS